MAIVQNKDGQGIKANGYISYPSPVFGSPVDPSYDVPTLMGTGVPAAASQYASQLAVDTATGNVYRALAGGSNLWIETNIR